MNKEHPPKPEKPLAPLRAIFADMVSRIGHLSQTPPTALQQKVPVSHDAGSPSGASPAKRRLLVIVEGDCLATQSLMERLLDRQCPIGDEGDGLTWIEVPSRYSDFVFAGIEILGECRIWQTGQLELEAAAASASRIIIAPLCAGLETDLDWHCLRTADVSIKRVAAQSPGQTGVASDTDQDPLDELLNLIGEFADQQNLLTHVGGY